MNEFCLPKVMRCKHEWAAHPCSLPAGSRANRTTALSRLQSCPLPSAEHPTLSFFQQGQGCGVLAGSMESLCCAMHGCSAISRGFQAWAVDPAPWVELHTIRPSVKTALLSVLIVMKTPLAGVSQHRVKMILSEGCLEILPLPSVSCC